MIMNYILTIFIAFIGAYIFKKMNIPVGAMLGSFFFVSIFQICSDQAIMLPYVKDVLQIASGVMIGCKISLEILKSLKKIWKIYLCNMFIMILIMIIMSIILVKISHINLITSILSLAPGGATDLTLLASEFHANMSYVALTHTARRLLIMILVPLLARTIASKEDKISIEKTKNNPIKYLFYAFFIGSIGGIVFDMIHIKAGLMIGAILLSAFYNIMIHSYSTNQYYTFTLQMFAGALVGVSMNQTLISQLSSLWIAVMIVSIETIIIILLNSLINKNIYKMSLMTSLLSSAPGALSDMTLLSEELGGDMPMVATLQILRMFSIILLIPILSSILILLI